MATYTLGAIQLLVNELTSQADEKWLQVDRVLAKQAGTFAADLAAAGPFIWSGTGEFLMPGACTRRTVNFCSQGGEIEGTFRIGFWDSFASKCEALHSACGV